MVRIVLGAMEIGRKAGFDESMAIFQTFIQHCEKTKQSIEVDTAYAYGRGKSEEYVSKISKDVIIATKACPWLGLSLSAENLRFQMDTSLKRLNKNKISIFYLHGPDNNVPLKETLKAVNEMHAENKFEEFGLSNFQAWQVSEVYHICSENNWIKPTVYQGMYSLLTRKVEDELLPCLRHYGIRFYAYSPLAGGILSDKYKFDDAFNSEGKISRFFGTETVKEKNRQTYWKKDYFDSCEKIKHCLSAEYPDKTISLCEAALRWIYYHSHLKKDDGILLGTSTSKQLEQNLVYLQEGPLSENVVDVINEVKEQTKHISPRYWSL